MFETREPPVGNNLKTAEECCSYLRQKHIFLNKVYEMLENSESDNRHYRKRIEVLVINVAGLGFFMGARYEEIVNRVTELGLELFSPREAIHFRAAYKNEEHDGYIHIGMRPIRDANNEPSVFCFSCQNAVRWIFGVSSNNIRPPDEWWAFIDPNFRVGALRRMFSAPVTLEVFDLS